MVGRVLEFMTYSLVEKTKTQSKIYHLTEPKLKIRYPDFWVGSAPPNLKKFSWLGFHSVFHSFVFKVSTTDMAYFPQ